MRPSPNTSLTETDIHWLRRGLITIATLLLVAAVAVLLTAISMRHAMHTALPGAQGQLDGTLAVAGLTAPVTVTRDEHGIPSLHATSLEDLLFAQGFITAQDRLFQMDALRRHGAGTLAELLGPSLVAHDRLQRTLRLRAAADSAVLVLPADQLHQLECYARGVNAFIATHADRLPIEFHLLHYTPEPWSPRDSLLIALVMSEDLSTSFTTKLNREELAAHLPAELLADLYPVGSWRDRVPSKTPLDLAAPIDKVDEIPLDRTQSSMHPTTPPNELRAIQQALYAGVCDGCLRGSNNWAVAGAHTASGAPLVSNDMHLALAVPSIWYEAGLHATGTHPLDVAGFTLPGVPFVITGRNAHLAWAFTNTGADVQDVYVEHTRGPNDHLEFERVDGSWSVAGHHPETIHVRFGRDVALDVITTRHAAGSAEIETPVISGLYPHERRALTLAWNVYDATNVTAPFYAIDAANDGLSLVDAFAGFGGPSQNLVYADAHHIGYHALGRIPIRGPAIAHTRTITPLDLLAPGEGGASAQSEDSTEESAAGTANTADDGSNDGSASPAAGSQLNSLLATTIGSPISDVPVDALDALQAWSGYVPFDQLPAVVDPANGTLATANARITPDAYVYTLTNDWGDPYRVERIHALLRGRDGLTPADMLRIQTDVHSDVDRMIAQRLAYAIDHTPHAGRRLQQAADLLRNFNGELTTGSAAAAIVVATRSELWPMLLTPQIAAHDHADARSSQVAALTATYTWGEKTTALETLLQHTPARWLPAGYPNWNAFLAAAVTQALDHAHAPRDLTRWRYGDYHPVEDGHPIFGSGGIFGRLLGTRTGAGTQPTGGDGTTVKAAGLHFGPSERFTADLADPDHTFANIVTGQSGQPSSPWYLDQFPLWLGGRTLLLPLFHPDVAHTLTLTPP